MTQITSKANVKYHFVESDELSGHLYVSLEAVQMIQDDFQYDC